MEHRLRITSDGTVGGALAFDQAGNDLTKLVSEIRWTHKAGPMPTAEVPFLVSMADVIGVDVQAEAKGSGASGA